MFPFGLERKKMLRNHLVFGLLVTFAVSGYSEIIYACDPSGAASVCKQQCNETVEGEVASNVCGINKCCTLLCNGPSSFCYEEGWTCADKGCNPSTAQVQCPDNGVCCQGPPEPSNWPDYPWPPYFGWPKDYVLPADYPFPNYWPNDWAPCPPSVYPEGVEPIDPAPTPPVTTPEVPPTVPQVPPTPPVETDDSDEDDSEDQATTTTTVLPVVEEVPVEEPEPITTEAPPPIVESVPPETPPPPPQTFPVVKKKKNSKKIRKAKAMKKRRSKKEKKN